MVTVLDDAESGAEYCQDIERQHRTAGIVGAEQDFFFESARWGVGLEFGENAVTRFAARQTSCENFNAQIKRSIVVLDDFIDAPVHAAGILHIDDLRGRTAAVDDAEIDFAWIEDDICGAVVACTESTAVEINCGPTDT